MDTIKRMYTVDSIKCKISVLNIPGGRGYMRQSAAIKKVVAVWTLICMMLPSFVFTVSAEKENISLANVVTEDE